MDLSINRCGTGELVIVFPREREVDLSGFTIETDEDVYAVFPREREVDLSVDFSVHGP